MAKLHEISIIGMGACGNHIVELGEGFNTIAINSTEEDTQQLNNVNNILLIGTEGCGKIKKNGTKLVKEKFEQYFDNLMEQTESSDMVVLIAGLGGGTGAGSISITADVLKSKLPNKQIILIGVLPSNTEDIRALRNSIEVCKEFNQLNLPYCLVDNGKVLESGSISECYDKINKFIIENIKVIRGDYNLPTSYGNMDVKDSKQLFSVPGLFTINKISGFNSTTFDETSFDDLILKSIKSSYNVQLQKDKIIKRLGLILTITEDQLSKFNRDIPKVKKEIGVPIETFLHVNICENERDCSIITILSGLSMPDSRLSEMLEIIEQSKESLRRKSTSEIKNIDESLKWLDEEDDEDQEEDNSSIDDIMSRY